MSVRRTFARWRSDERGQDLIEYALLVATIGLAGIVGVQALGVAMKELYENADEAVQEASECTPDPGGACGP